MALEPAGMPPDEESAARQSRAVKLAFAGVALFFSGPLLMSFSSSLDIGDFLLVLMLSPLLMAGGIGMTIYWSIAAWRRRAPRRQPAPRESLSLLTADATPDDGGSYGQPEPEVEKKGGFSFLLVVVITVCSTHTACIGAIHTAKPTSGDFLGFGILITVAMGSALAALISGLAASLLRSYGWVKTVRVAAAVLFVGSIGAQMWHTQAVKAEAVRRRAQNRLSYGLDEPMPTALDFRIHVDINKWDDLTLDVPEIDIDGRDWSLRYVYHNTIWHDPPTEECTGKLNPREATELQELLVAVRARMDAGRPLCAELPGGEIRLNLNYSGVDGDWSWEANEDCVLRPDNLEPEAGQLYYLISNLAPVWEGEERVTCKYLVTPEEAARISREK